MAIEKIIECSLVISHYLYCLFYDNSLWRLDGILPTPPNLCYCKLFSTNYCLKGTKLSGPRSG